jgi:hypothetical protein
MTACYVMSVFPRVRHHRYNVNDDSSDSQSRFAGFLCRMMETAKVQRRLCGYYAVPRHESGPEADSIRKRARTLSQSAIIVDS